MRWDRVIYRWLIFFSLVWWRQSIKMPQASRSSLRHNGILHILNNSSLPKLISWNSITHITMITSGYFGTCLDYSRKFMSGISDLKKEVMEAHLASFTLWGCSGKIPSMMQKANRQQRKKFSTCSLASKTVDNVFLLNPNVSGRFIQFTT